jgi:membrane protease YdiL (CAAX protease family)
MENQSEPEKQLPEAPYVRPPGLEMGNGLAIFMLVFVTFIFAQVIAMMLRVKAVTPDLASIGWSDLFRNDAFIARWNELSSNGDSIAWVELIAGTVGLCALLLICRWWKRDRMVQFLGLRPPAFRPFLAWCGVFVGLFIAIEMIGRLLPNVCEQFGYDLPLDSEFMTKVLASITNYPLFYLGSCLLPALFEELLFRGVLLGSLRHLLDKNTAIAITAGLFTFTHMQYEWYLMLFNLLPLAVFLGYARTNTGSIWTGVFLHFVNNAASIILPQML